jgi:hypothetical protein
MKNKLPLIPLLGLLISSRHKQGRQKMTNRQLPGYCGWPKKEKK